MSRIPLFPDADFTPEQRAVYDKMVAGPRGMVVGPIRAALHSPELADRWQAIGEFLRYRTSLPARLSELAIVVCGRYWNSPVEWYVHADLAEKAGVPMDVLMAISSARPPPFRVADEALTYEFSRQLVEVGQVEEEAYQAALRSLGVVGLVELTALVGYYSMVAMMLNAHDVPTPDEETPRFRILDSTVQRNGRPTGLPPSAVSSAAPVAGE